MLKKSLKYNHQQIEKKWQKFWEKDKVWRAKDPPAGGPKWYSLIEFPYPSGDGLHVGHIRSNTAMDIVSRKRRMEGYNVLYPIGWDAFGLPTENYAIKTGVAPEKATAKNVKTFTRQLKALGFSFDWDREINTTDPDYYKWTQWIFLQFLKHGLAYKDSTYINWCLSCKTGLANEEIVGGHCERCGGEVEKRLRKQWMLRITAYADKLLEGLNHVNFLEEIKTQQRNWIGRSEGRLIDFNVTPRQARGILGIRGILVPERARASRGATFSVKVFTTRPDTIDGATFLVLAPENPLINVILSEVKNLENKEEVKKYIKKVLGKSELERQENRIKTGVELKGVVAINPYNNEKIPVWVSDYVLMHYGTGAIMAVPQHDERDREFAEKFKLLIKDVPLVSKSKWPGKEQINYKLRDWVFSRQRYWGEPIPIIICEKCGFVPVPEKDLPVILPKVKNYQPRDDGQSPLASATNWLKVKCPDCGGPAERETDTMPNWAGSSWYFIAYVVPDLISSSRAQRSDLFLKLKHWLPVDWYNGGMEHTTLHLLYSRFWNQFLYDIGVVPVSEPYQKRTAHGLVLGEDGQKMSKSRGNVINPDSLVKEFGADALRLYEMFMGPFDEYIPWSPQGIVGTYRFCNKVWQLCLKKDRRASLAMTAGDSDLERLLHQTIKKVSEDIEEMKFNTAISALMILVNKMEEVASKSVISNTHYLILLKLLFPFAPHLAQELWQQISNFSINSKNKIVSERSRGTTLLDFEPWPVWDKDLIVEEKFELVIQVNGKVRGTLTAKRGISRKEAEKLAATHPIASKWLKDSIVKKIVFVPDRLINFIV